MKKNGKNPEAMSMAELARATKKFDEPYIFEKARPMTVAERAEERKLRRGRGRPKVGAGAKKISVSLEGKLLKQADAVAKKRGINRSELIARFVADGLRSKTAV